MQEDRGKAGDRRWWALGLLCVAHLLVVIDVSVVNVALPSIQRELGFSEASLSWVVNAYALAFGGFLLLGGRLADLLGRRAVFGAGLLLFALASLACGLAPSAGALVAARAAQGLGGAVLVPAALSIVATTFAEGAERNRALGIFGSVGGLGFVVGVLLGGLLAGTLGWRWVFFVNVPVGLAAVALAPSLIPEGRAERTPGAAASFDPAGAATATAGLAALVYAAAGAGGPTAPSRTAGFLVLAALLLGAFVLVEGRAPHPLAPLAVLRRRAVAGPALVMLATGAGFVSTFYFVTLYLQLVLGFGPLATGLAFLPLALAIIVAANAASALATRYGPEPVLLGGLVLLAFSLLWLGRVGAEGTYLGGVLAPSALAGLGVGSCVVPLTILAVGGVSSETSGLASGLITTAQQVGGAVGLAALAALAAARTGATAGAATAPEALTAGFRVALTSGSGLALVGLVLALTLIRGRGPTVPGDPADGTGGP